MARCRNTGPRRSLPGTDETPSEEALLIEPESWTQQLALGNLFETAQPLAIDIGCGKGRFLLARAEAFPGINFLGVERLLSRLHKIEKRAYRRGLTNIRLLRVEATYAVEHLLPNNCANQVYLFFPDPWPKRRHHRRRLFCADFLDSLHRIMISGGELHVATDHPDYFASIEKLLSADRRFARIETFVPPPEQQTDFERIFLTQEAEIGRCSCRKL